MAVELERVPGRERHFRARFTGPAGQLRCVSLTCSNNRAHPDTTAAGRAVARIGELAENAARNRREA